MLTVFVSCIQILILDWQTTTSVLKIKNTNILGDGNRGSL
jgi:hypothetical protein